MVLGNSIACTEPGLEPSPITLIGGVPDTNQPPTQNLTSTVSKDNYCAPMAMVNILEYWDDVMGHANAQNVTAGLAPNTTAEYLGYFMDTNSFGSLNRGNGMDGHSGTYAKDIGPGAWEFVRWDAGNLFATPLPALPAGKIGYNWAMPPDFGGGPPTGFDFYKAEIDAGRPLVVCFRYWNLNYTGIQKTDPATNETIHVFEWGVSQNSSDHPDPEEEWNLYDGEHCIGHAVTGVGYILNWDPDGSGPKNYVIVHDNWDTTPRNVAIPWANWNSNHAADPGPDGVPPDKQDLTISIGGFPCGSVTTPGVGTFTCDKNAMVNLVATPWPVDCYFDNWTGNVGTIADDYDATTTIFMDGDYSITANFFFTPVIPA